MKKKDRPPLSERIRQWEKGPSDGQQIQNTINEIKKAFKKDDEFQEKLKTDKIQINLRGSLPKNDAIAVDFGDVDIQIVFLSDVELKSVKKKCFELLRKEFGAENVVRRNIALEIRKNQNRRKVDLIVGKQKDVTVVAFSDKDKREVEFYPTFDQKKVAKLNELNCGSYSRMARAFKGLKAEMETTGYIAPQYVNSYLIECLLAVVKPRIYKRIYCKGAVLDDLIRFTAILNSLTARLNRSNEIKKMKELNERKPLFVNEEAIEKAQNFWQAAREYVVKTYNSGR